MEQVAKKREGAKERVFDCHSCDFSFYGRSESGESEKKDIHLGVGGQRFSKAAGAIEAHVKRRIYQARTQKEQRKKWLEIN